MVIVFVGGTPPICTLRHGVLSYMMFFSSVFGIIFDLSDSDFRFIRRGVPTVTVFACYRLFGASVERYCYLSSLARLSLHHAI